MRVLIPGILLLFSMILSGCVGTDTLPDTVIRIDLIAPQTTLEVGDSLVLQARLINSFSDAFEGPVAWISEAPTIASVSQSGVVTGLAVGQARIRAVNDSLESNELLLTVFADPNQPAEVRVSGSINLLSVGETMQLTAAVLNATGGTLPNAVITWESANTTIAEVSATGLVTAKAGGGTNITARSGNIQSQPYSLMVGVGASEPSGTFQGRNGYNVSGGVSFSANASLVDVNLAENFRSQSGPGLYVYLSNSPSSVAGGVEIGKLRKTSGADTYTDPQGINMDSYNYVIILCKPFNIPFGAALLQ